MNRNHKTIAVVIVNYNAGDTLQACAKSIYESDLAQKQEVQVIVVDNASRDGSLEKCRTSYSLFTYIVNSHNLGFAAGVNIGMRYALEKQYKKIILLNPDAVLEPDCLRELSQTLDDPSIGIVTPLIHKSQKSDDNALWYAGATVSYKKHFTAHKYIPESTHRIYDTEVATGCVMGISAKLCKKIGLLDERYFLYYEDADYSVRAANAGFRVVVNPLARAWHDEVSENPNNKLQKTYFLVLSGLIFFYTHSRGTGKVWFFGYTLVRRLRITLKCLIIGDPLSQTLQKAFKDFHNVKKDRHISPYR